MTGSLLCERLREGALSPKQRVYRAAQSDRRSRYRSLQGRIIMAG